jgi:hypothetical protein
MNDDVIARAIAESREREKKSTEGPWRYDMINAVHPDRDYAEHGDPPEEYICTLAMMRGSTMDAKSTERGLYNGLSIAAARTYEPRFREALALAVGEVEKLKIATLHDRTAQWCDDLLTRIKASFTGKDAT